MGCLKCGKDTGASSVFCDECLAKMSEYPIKIDTAVHLPPRTPVVSEKKPVHKKKQPTPAELLKKYRKRISRLSVAVAILVISLLVCLGILAYTMGVLDELQRYAGIIPK